MKSYTIERLDDWVEVKIPQADGSVLCVTRAPDGPALVTLMHPPSHYDLAEVFGYAFKSLVHALEQCDAARQQAEQDLENIALESVGL